jgi:hypothetical protein
VTAVSAGAGLVCSHQGFYRGAIAVNCSPSINARNA